MDSELYRRAKDLFLAACERSLQDRSAFLDQACGGDTELRSEVESLLEYHNSGDTTSWQPDDTNGPVTGPVMPKNVGSYRIIQLVGEGGMGEVYEAEQEEPVRRRVALKLIKWGMNTREVVARFESERQALALMDHPNIARVYEAGATEEGRPYFAMEFVRGVPITDYCDSHRLSLPRRLEIFVAVCEGIQHAHRRGVIHRDVKPSNLLVTVHDDRPVPKVIDFGVAKATSQRLTERTVFTELGQWIGTPEYMSPEQADLTGLDIDTRTDVYSLGVVLYELLAGVQPFDSTTLRGAGFDEMRRRIREEEPPRPSTRISSQGDESEVAARRRRSAPERLAKDLRGDLDWIVMKCLEKDRTRRYDSPLDLAADITRYLSNQPVEAGPPGTAYRLKKFIRRNRVSVAAGAMIVVALILGMIGTTIGLVRAKHQAQIANQVAGFMEGIFADLDPTESGRVQSPEMILDRGGEKIEKELAGQPLVQARLMTTMGIVYLNLGQLDRARELMETGLEIRRAQLDPSHPDLAVSLNALAWYHYRMSQFDRSRELYETALAIQEQAYGPSDPRVAVTARQLGRAHWVQGHLDIADELYTRALDVLDSPGGRDDLELASALHWYGILLVDQGEFRSAEAAFERAIAIRTRILGAEHPAVGWPLTELGRVLHNLGRLDAAEECLLRSQSILESSLGPDARDIGFPLSALADVLQSRGRAEEALPLYERALEIREGIHGSNDIEVLWTLPGYGWALLDSGEVERAQNTFHQAVALSRSLFPDGHYIEGMAELGLGQTLRVRGMDVEGRAHLERSLEISEAFLPRDHVWLSWPLLEVSSAHRDEGDCRGSKELLERALTIWRNQLGSDHIYIARGLQALAHWEGTCGDAERVGPLLSEANAVAERFGSPSHPIAVDVAADLEQHQDTTDELQAEVNRDAA